MEALEQFLSCYFHQDWYLESPSWEAVVCQFVAAEPEELRMQALEQLDAFIGRDLSEADLASELLELGCCFEPSSATLSHQSWLSQLRAHLAEACRP
jgi:hypothetical protein